MIAMLRICCIKCLPNRVNIAANANARDKAPHLRGCIYNLQFGIRPCIMPARTETSTPDSDRSAKPGQYSRERERSRQGPTSAGLHLQPPVWNQAMHYACEN